MTPFTSSQQLLASGPPACIKTGAKVKRNPLFLQLQGRQRTATLRVSRSSHFLGLRDTDGSAFPWHHIAQYSWRSFRTRARLEMPWASALATRCQASSKWQVSSKTFMQ